MSVSSENKVLIITYYWPPSGGSGVQRWLKFVKYLPQFGITPYVFTPENPSFEIRDPTLLKDVPDEAEVIHFPIWEPYSFVKRLKKIFFGKPKGNNLASTSSLPGSLAAWIRGNLFFPDPRIFWVKPSVLFLEDFIRSNRITKIITTGPPHSVHLIGLRLKRKKPDLIWLADFRDPWSEWGTLLSFKLSGWALNRHRKMEKRVLTEANMVITITPFYVKQLEHLSGRRVELITNGFDDEDFNNFKIKPTEKFVIRHVGIIHSACNPVPFLEAFKSWIADNVDLQDKVIINFTGQVNSAVYSYIESDPLLTKAVQFTPGVPHAELISLYRVTSALLLILTGYKDGEGFLPGKLFEYMATGLPIIAIGSVQSDAATLLNQYDDGKMIESTDTKTIRGVLQRLFESWQKGRLPITKSSVTPMYSRREITKKLADLIFSL